MTGRSRVGGAVLVTAVAASGVAVAAQPASRSATAARAAIVAPDRVSEPLRTAVAAPGRAADRARAALRSRGLVVTGAASGGVNSVERLGGFLTARSSANGKTVALAWIRSHRAALGLSSADIGKLALVRDYTSTDGVRHLQWAQRVNGITIVDRDLRANVASGGRLVNVGGGATGALDLNAVSPAFGPDSAYKRTLASVGAPARVPARTASRGDAARTTTYREGGRAGLVAYSAGDGVRLAWRVIAPSGATGDYDALVDARSGRVVRRTNLVRFANALAHDNSLGFTPGGTPTTKNITPYLNAGATTLNGNNTHAFVDADDETTSEITPYQVIDHFDVPPAGEVHPSSGSDWLYPVTPVAAPASPFCPVPGCTWDSTTPLSWQTNAKQAATQLFYLVNKYHDHLLSTPIGFDEQSGNFQQTNASGKGKGGDAILAQADDGANTDSGLPDGDHIDNAYFDTRPDGIPAQMAMFLWSDPFAEVNGVDDPSIVFHEFTHGLSNRLITDAQGFGTVAGIESGAMGEAWSDWYALDYLAREGYITDAATAGDVREGAYLEDDQDLIRTEPIDCPPGADPDGTCPGFPETGPGGYTYGDFGKIAYGLFGGVPVPEPHGDGEIWGQTLWQLRQALVAKYGQAGGSDRAERDITGGMRLGPSQPSMLDQRNAILQADTVAGGQDQDLIWSVFASRGMGYFASSRGDFDYLPEEDFSTPPAAEAPRGTVSGTVVSDAGQPVAGVTVGFSGHDAPPAAGPALQAVTGADGTYSISGVPFATYPHLFATAPKGYSRADANDVTVNGPLTRDFALRRNYADTRDGATIASDARDESAYGCPATKLADSDESTAVDTDSPLDPANPGPRTFTVTLSAPVSDPEVLIDPTPGCYNLISSGLYRYAIQASSDGSTFTTVGSGIFTAASLDKLNAVSLHDVPASVKAMRLVALDSFQTPTGIPDFGFLSISEFQVLGRTPAAVATPTATAPYTIPTETPTATPTATPTPAPTIRKTPGLKATVRPKRDRVKPFRFTTRGTLKRPSGISKAAGCTGRVRVSVTHKGSSTVLNRRIVRLGSGCGFTSRVAFKNAKRLGAAKGTLRFTIRFLGNTVLRPKTVKRSASYGRK